MVILPDGEIRFEFSDLAHDYGFNVAEKAWNYLNNRGERATSWIDPKTGEEGRFIASQKLDYSLLMDITFYGDVCRIADQIKEEEDEDGSSC